MSGREKARAAKIVLCQRLSVREPFESWQARRVDTDEYLFLKQPSNGRAQVVQDARELLANVREVFPRLRHHDILHPLDIETESGVSITYPFLSPTRWQPLTGERFRQSDGAILPQMCAVLDFIHSLGVVHCDIKPEHFMISSDAEPSLRLIDFDLAQFVGTRPKKLVGTPHYIASEFLRNQIILPQTDHYSLGITLMDLIAPGWRKEQPTLESELLEGLTAVEIDERLIPAELRDVGRFAAALLKIDPRERPDYLGGALAAALGYSAEAKVAYDKQLIWDSLRSWYSYRSRRGRAADLIETVQKGAKLIGVPEEILRDAQQALSSSPLAVTRSLKRMLAGVDQEYLGEYWRLQIDEAGLRSFYQAGWIQKHQTALTVARNSSHWQDGTEFCRSAAGRGELVKALTVLRPLLDQLEQESLISPGELVELTQELARLYKSLGYVELADQYFQRCLESDALSAADRVQVLLELADPNTGQTDHARSMELLEAAQIEAEASGLEDLVLHIRNRKASSLLQTGDVAGCIAALEEAKQHAAAADLALPHARFCNVLAYAYAKSGRLLEARAMFEEGLKSEQKADFVPLRIALLNNLLSVELSLGDYSACQEHGKQALDLAAMINDPVKAAYAHRELAICYAFVGDHQKAERHVSQFLSIGIATGNRRSVMIAKLRWGWIELRRSQLDRAEELLLSARRLLAAEGSIDLVYADFYLGMIEAWRGNLDVADVKIREILDDHRQTSNRVLVLDAELMLLWIDRERNGSFDFRALESSLKRGLEIGYRFGVAKAAFYLLTSDGYFKSSPDWEILRAALANLEQDHGILAEITCTLLAYRESENSGEAALGLLKDVFTRLLRAQQLPEAIPVAEMLSERYRSLNPKLAVAFLERAAELYGQLGNETKQHELTSKGVRSLRRQSSFDTGLLTAIEELTSLLNSITDYRHVLDKILATALRLTGAERAVLLLADRVDGNLRVEAASEYDTQSLKDITAISNSVVRNVYDSREPCLISDATQHESTKGFPSIIMHNILSVACIPLALQGERFGALYLDHHTLWGLFTPEDHRLMNVLGNFVAIAVGKARHLRNLELSVSQSRSQLEEHGIQVPIITEDSAMLQMLKILPTIAQTDTSVLITGESGTGKELLAEMIHRESGRADGPFIMINCSTLDHSLVDAELFGIAPETVHGARAREGKFEAADGGTVFLDEIGELPLGTQAKLLRVLENKNFDRLGSNQPVNVDFRLLAATNADLKDLLAAGKFREDLYYRIQAVEMQLPPLRERPGDIMLLIRHFLQVFNRDGLYRFPPETRRALHRYEWPGNVRQLKNVVERIILVVPPGDVRPEHLPPEIAKLKSGPYAAAMREKAEEVEKAMILRALQENSWNKSKAARALGMPLSTLRRKMEKYNIKKPPDKD